MNYAPPKSFKAANQLEFHLTNCFSQPSARTLLDHAVLCPPDTEWIAVYESRTSEVYALIVTLIANRDEEEFFTLAYMQSTEHAVILRPIKVLDNPVTAMAQAADQLWQHLKDHGYIT